ncbi:MAG: phospholipase, partial [Anaerolinea sp.]|nr:phospholipase [Anaerolinea sp.]
VDAHIPKSRVEETAAVLEGLDAQVTLRLYPGMGHTINADEITQARGLLREVLAPARLSL